MATKIVNDPTYETEGSANLDPITGEPGAHPVGVGLGAASAGAAGAAIGAAGGPVGAAIGAAVGAVIGGLAGKSVAESVDPTAEEAYWRDAYVTRPYYTSSYEYDDYAPAYQRGWEARSEFDDATFEELEPELEREWSTVKPQRRLSWDQARHASRDAWDRVDRQFADRD